MHPALTIPFGFYYFVLLALTHTPCPLMAQAAGVAVPQSSRQGRAKHLLPDTHFLDSAPLGEAYRICETKARRRAGEKRMKSFTHLRNSKGESFSFGREWRARLSPELLQRIRELNPVDYELWELGKELLKVNAHLGIVF